MGEERELHCHQRQLFAVWTGFACERSSLGYSREMTGYDLHTEIQLCWLLHRNTEVRQPGAGVQARDSGGSLE